MKRKYGIESLGAYQEGGSVEESPGWWERFREGRRERERESSDPRPLSGAPPLFPFIDTRPPLFARQFVADLAGNFLRDRGMEKLGDLIGSREINADDLSRAEYKALQEAAIRSMGREGASRGGDTWQLNYDDYGLDDLADYISVNAPGMVPQKFKGEVDQRRAEHEQTLRDQGYTQEHIDNLYAQSFATRAQAHQVLKDIEGGQSISGAFLSSPAAFSLAGSIGSARVRKDPDTGEYWIEDEYDFNDAANLPEDASFWADAAKEGFVPTPGNLYGQARNLAKYYGSQPGEGSPIRINLGTLVESEADEEPSRLARGIGWLGNLFDRERPAEEAPTPPAQEVDQVAELLARLRPTQRPQTTEDQLDDLVSRLAPAQMPSIQQ